MTESWRDDARCATVGPDVMYPGGSGYEAAVQTAEAKAVCAHCPVTAQCLELALRLEGDATAAYRGGVWAGTTPIERANLARKQVAA
jgi:WhiB family redox-sensing transcriptional regulator